MMMPEKRTIAKARKDKRAGKAATTQAGEFVHEEIRKIRRGEHGARSPQQAIAIGLSKARRAGVDLAPPGKGKAKERTRRSAAYAYAAGQHKRKTHRRPRGARAVSRVPAEYGVACRAGAAGARRRRAPFRLAALWCRTQGGAHQKPSRSFGRGTQGGSHQGAAQKIANTRGRFRFWDAVVFGGWSLPQFRVGCRLPIPI